MLDSYPQGIHTNTYYSLSPKNRNQKKRFYRLLFHAQVFRYEVLRMYLMEQYTRLELVTEPWQGPVLPLN